jgi:hypothetical protein
MVVALTSMFVISSHGGSGTAGSNDAATDQCRLNTATYWHALRANGIDDKVWGYGSLLEQF